MAKLGIIAQLKGFFHEVKMEMGKVSWPSKEDLKASTTVCLIFLGIMAVIVGGMDIIFNKAVLLLFSLT